MNTTENNRIFNTNVDMEEFEIRLNRLRKFKNLPDLVVNELYCGRNKLSTCLWNLDKQQDFTWSTCVNDIMCAIVADGHGESTVVNWLKSKPDDYFIAICKQINPLEELENDHDPIESKEEMKMANYVLYKLGKLQDVGDI